MGGSGQRSRGKRKEAVLSLPCFLPNSGSHHWQGFCAAPARWLLHHHLSLPWASEISLMSCSFNLQRVTAPHCCQTLGALASLMCSLSPAHPWISCPLMKLSQFAPSRVDSPSNKYPANAWSAAQNHFGPSGLQTLWGETGRCLGDSGISSFPIIPGGLARSNLADPPLLLSAGSVVQT